MEVVKMMLADTGKFEEVGVWKDMAGASRCIVDYWLGFLTSVHRKKNWHVDVDDKPCFGRVRVDLSLLQLPCHTMQYIVNKF
jgi:hypothetical protein